MLISKCAWCSRTIQKGHDRDDGDSIGRWEFSFVVYAKMVFSFKTNLSVDDKQVLQAGSYMRSVYETQPGGWVS